MAGISDLQPTKLSRWIAGTTIPLAAGATGLYEVLQKLGLAVESLAEPLVRLLLGLGVFSLGMAALNISLVRHIYGIRRRTNNSPLPKPIDPPVSTTAPTVTETPKSLSDIEIEILTHLSRFKSSPVSEIAKTLRKQPALVEYHLNELEDDNYIYATHGSMSPSQWYIDQRGRKALVGLGVLK